VRSRATIPIAAAVLVAIGAVVATVGLRYYIAHRDLRFDRAAWMAAKTHGYCKKSRRGRMLDDLVHNHLRPGTPMTRVRRLLGTPDGTSDGTRGSWTYEVDREEEVFLPTCVYLVLHTHGGRLQHAEVYRDS
jgi:hypothetical protein